MTTFSQPPAVQPVLVGIDVGGTFTDFVIVRDGQLTIHKASTTPDDQSRAIVHALQELGLLTSQGSATQAIDIIHGMTVATNALLERRGAVTALITTAGFADVLVIGRQNRPHLYRFSQQRAPALVADQLRLEVNERLDSTGAVLQPLDETSLEQIVQTLVDSGVESLAVVLLFSFRNPAHERRIADLVQARLPQLPISLSSAILPEYREYERTATTVINAYVQPLVARYLTHLEQALNRGQVDFSAPPSPRIRIMQSNGGAIGLAQAAEQAARLVLSGPAGGVVGAFAIASQAFGASPALMAAGKVNILTFDMGGTSTDVALCPGEIRTTAESTISDLPLRLPIIDIHTVGAGGGSVAFVDSGGGLHVGPRSAGALPGPVCYGRGGTEPTVTDANLVLGRLTAAGFLGGHGDVTIDGAGALAALTGLGHRLGLTTAQTALGVIQVANATMEAALRRVSVERGYDPRLFTLLPFGGAGPLHACDLAEALGVRRILVPLFPGVLSAYGMLVADVATDLSQSILLSADALLLDSEPLHTTFAALSDRVRAILQLDGVLEPAVQAALDMRYRGQSYELTVPLNLPVAQAAVADAVATFHALHAQRYGYAIESEAVEVVTLRVRGSGPGAQIESAPLPLGAADATAARLADQPVWFDAVAPTPTPCYSRELLQPGNRFAGPAIVLQFDTTTVVAPGWQAHVDGYQNLWLEHP